MIGSHDTFSYLPSTCPVHNWLTRTWRTQCKTIMQQYLAGVHFFDLRVCQHRGNWYFCHGLARFKSFQFKTLDAICDWMDKYFSVALYRIVLERGNVDEFLAQAGYLSESICTRHQNLWRVDIKAHGKWNGEVGNNDFELYNRGYKFATLLTWEEPNRELHGETAVRNFYKIDLRKEAERCNTQLGIFSDPNAFELAAQSKDALYLLDYCTGDYDD